MTRAAAVFAGGAVGSVLRWALAATLPAAVPWGTLAANVAGSFVLGALTGLAAGRPGSSAWAGLTTGVLGSFTTFSAFAVETTTLRPVAAAAYVVLTLTSGLAAAAAGLAVARRPGAGP